MHGSTHLPARQARPGSQFTAHTSGVHAHAIFTNQLASAGKLTGVAAPDTGALIAREAGGAQALAVVDLAVAVVVDVVAELGAGLNDRPAGGRLAGRRAVGAAERAGAFQRRGAGLPAAGAVDARDVVDEIVEVAVVGRAVDRVFPAFRAPSAGPRRRCRSLRDRSSIDRSES